MSLEPDLTVEDLVRLFSVHPETVRVWLRADRFPNAYRPSRRAGWRIPRADVEAFRQRHRQGQT
jgi:transposase-like protein